MLAVLLFVVCGVSAAPPPVTMDVLDVVFDHRNILDFHETNPNQTSYGSLVEGDILIDDEDRKATEDDRLWQNRMYKYEIRSDAEPDRWAIMKGISFWREHSCVDFQEVDSSSTQSRVQFIKDAGCWSHVGNTARYSSSRTQQLSLGDGCTGFGTVVHEIGHSLGFYHEQSRSDRDDYVVIATDNVQSGREYNFRKASTHNHAVEYDYSSIMHYGGRYFSKNTQMTIITKDPTKQRLLGNRENASFRDVKLMNEMYQCSQLCSSPPSCLNGGYVDAQCVCRCPPNTSGVDCAHSSGDYYPTASCGGVITTPQRITSPNWPQVYPLNTDCTWWIRPAHDKTVHVHYSKFAIFQRFYGDCIADKMHVRNGGLISPTVTSCGKELETTSDTATGPGVDMILQFVSGDFDWGNNEGFVIDVSFV